MRTKESQRKINSLILLLLCTATLLITSTYAWFTAQKNVAITNLTASVNVTDGLSISVDGLNWSQEINFESIARDAYTYDGHSATNLVDLEELLPVSYIGSVASGLTKLPMYQIKYTNGTMTSVTDVSAYESNPSGDTAYNKAGYIAFDLFFRDTTPGSTTDTTLKLKNDASAGLLANGSDQEITTAGTENTIRVAFCRYDTNYYVAYSSTQDQVLGALYYGKAGLNIDKIAIWEPNAYSHVQAIVSSHKVKTSASNVIDNTINTTTNMTTHALKGGNIANYSNIDLYDWSGTNTTVTNLLGAQVTTQTGHTADNYVITTGGNTNLVGDEGLTLTATDSQPFTIPTNKITKVRVYVWLEGQDIDCTDLASGGYGININLSLTK
jgi:hypothetical protein